VEIDALPGDVADPDASFTGTADDLRSPWISGIRAVFYRIDGDTRWRRGGITGGIGTAHATWRVSLATTLAPGPHTISVMAVDDRSTAVSTSDFGSGFVAAPIGSAAMYAFSTVDTADEVGPAVLTPTVVPSAVPVTGSMRLSAIADDSATGASAIASVEYSLDGGAWRAMDATDGVLDSAMEACAATIGPFATPGVHSVAVRAEDAAGNTSVSAAGECAVIDPRGGSVVGTVRFGPVSPVPQPLLSVSAGYKAGQLRSQSSFSGPGVSFEATTAQWLAISGDLAVLSATGVLGDGSRAVCTAWLADRTPTGRKDLARVRVVTADGVAIYDSEPGAAFTSRPSSPVTRGGVRVVAPRRASILWTPSVRSR
jgi:hypothetical protein